jgi:hypothetical protein
MDGSVSLEYDVVEINAQFNKTVTLSGVTVLLLQASYKLILIFFNLPFTKRYKQLSRLACQPRLSGWYQLLLLPHQPKA